jgi:hypothetical protein
MASVSAKALDQSAVEVVQGPYRVVSTTMKVDTRERVELHNLTDEVREFVG